MNMHLFILSGLGMRWEGSARRECEAGIAVGGREGKQEDGLIKAAFHRQAIKGGKKE